MSTKNRTFGFFCFFALYEITVYLTNDMVMPAMLDVIRHFHGAASDIGLSLTLYIVGGSLLQVFLGPLAERIGERSVLLAGNALFLLATAAIPFCSTMEQFLAVRFVQGMGTCFIFLGYAVLHELLDDAAAVKLTTLLSNAGVFAPLVGPVIGSAVLGVASWPAIFWLACGLSLVSLLGLAKTAPHPDSRHRETSVRAAFTSYLTLLRSPRFMLGVFIAGLSLAPLTAWIGLSPAIVLGQMARSRSTYILFQVSIFSGFVFSSICVQRLASWMSMRKMVHIGTLVALSGVLLAAGFDSFDSLFILGMSIFSAGLGLFNGALLRMTMTATAESTRLASAALSLLYCLSIALGLEAYNRIGAAFDYSLHAYAWTNVPVCLAVFLLARRFVRLQAPEPPACLLPAT